MLILSKDFEDAIRTEGKKSYPNECCGILIGTIDEDEKKMVKHIEPIHNAREDDEQYHRFLITPKDMLHGEQLARKNGMEVIGFYHSHPDHAAVPSDYDKEHALPFYSYVIVSVMQGEAKETTSWELTSDRNKFLQEEKGGS